VADFAQTGPICTLQQLNETHLPAIERELETLSIRKPIALVVPCLGSDLREPALRHLVEEIRKAGSLQQIVLSVNGADDTDIEQARALLDTLPQRMRFLWNDRPTARELLSRWPGAGGKGLNVWAALGVLYSEGEAEIIALQDADVSSFRRETLARLCYPCAQPQLGYTFSKLYYSRNSEQLHGRMTRLFLTPLLRALSRAGSSGSLLEFLLGFRYPLAGELACSREVAGELQIGSGWSVELTMLCEAFKKLPMQQICQVEGGSSHDHRHRSVSSLAAACSEIAESLRAELAEFWREDQLSTAFLEEAELALRRSSHLARINQLTYDEPEEREVIRAFSAAILARAPSPPVILPSWSSLIRAVPEWCATFLRAIEVG
jgi:glucosyl-3-phosphoglycerate synthase